MLIDVRNFFQGVKKMTPEQGCHNQLWASAVSTKEDLVNGALYYPIGVLANNELDKVARSESFARELWDWTNSVLDVI